MEVLDLFPRSILKGQLPDSLLKTLLSLSQSVLDNPEASADASVKLAGQLSQQRELRPDQPGVQELMLEHLLPSCDRWIRHVMDRQPPQGRGPWVPGRYELKPIDLWLNCQKAGDYNPTHTHGGSFSGVIFLAVPPQITANSFDGQLCFHGPEEWHVQSFRTGMSHYVLPVPGDFYVFPAWQPHSVMPFRGDGERWSLAFNAVAVPKSQAHAAPSSSQIQQPRQSTQAVDNVSLSSYRPSAKGF
ncbi:putative 2OG-Fe(II) oxygenase [Synechococcus sp. UW105]|uniref:putative 2OG-Fe(II) oxygenase n=1 Tax=Synechococcus sp. UW105 TaxID=337067 RepID=UPI000E0FC686|nr:putative 2OG-Fe(II) oxygenase [Synechococcus sp. UW105]